jgi:hypothetical protein
MKSRLRGAAAILLATCGFACAWPANPQAPADKPFAMRGVQLGITVDEFRQAAIPHDNEPNTDLQSYCSTDDVLSTVSVEVSSEDRADGIVNCEWISYDGFGLTHHWVDIGTGQGQPTFQFLADEAGVLRLFRIKFYANGKYYAGIRDALARGYGLPEMTILPFQTLTGSEFTSTMSVWDNGLSTITLIERCGHLERYCLTYDHSKLVKTYDAMVERRAAAAAAKI